MKKKTPMEVNRERKLKPQYIREVKFVQTNRYFQKLQKLCKASTEIREKRKRKEHLKEAERKRKHEIETAKIYATASASVNQRVYQSPQVFLPESMSPIGD